jgi:Rps23 Pro-64 3,4-dihydroxylase Tpa1-like proline 4-hydroxylase
MFNNPKNEGNMTHTQQDSGLGNYTGRNKFKINYPELYQLADKLKNEYQCGSPFPNIAIDNFFSQGTYNNICAAFPLAKSNIWKTPTNKHTINRSVTKHGELELKESLLDENQRRLLMELNSSLFIKFIEKLSGIEGLIPDPYFAEGGYNITGTGGILGIHADFSHHNKLGLERRVNFLAYINDEWKESYGGALSLYDENENCIKKIFPFGNRIVAFTTSPTSFHGFPEPLKTPKHIFRQSIHLYYYTIPRKDREVKRLISPSDPEFVHTITKE